MEARLRQPGLLIAALFSSTAWGNDCPTPYTVDSLLEDLTLVETGLREGDESGVTESAGRLQAGMGCLDEVLPALIAARAYRAVGAGLLVGGDGAGAEKWLLTSLEVDPTWEYGIQDIPDGHRLRADFDDLKRREAVDPVPVAGKQFADGTYYLNGRKIGKPAARPDRFHVFQSQTATLSTSVIEGNAFPASALTDAPSDQVAGGKPAKTKQPKTKAPKQSKIDKAREKSAKTKKDKADKVAKSSSKPPKERKVRTKTITLPDGTTRVVDKRVRPPEKTPLLIGGGAIIVGSGVLYALAGQTASRMRDVRTVADVPGNPPLQLGEPADRKPIRYCGDGESPDTSYNGDGVYGGCYTSPRTEVDRLRGRANQLLYASVSVLAVGVGVTTWGVMVDGDLVMPRVHVRF